jgi:CBS domain-containing protein
MPETLPLEKLKDFMNRVPPFHLLPENAVDQLVRELLIEYFPKGEVILNPKGPPTQFLYIIRSGGVKFLVREKDGGSEKIYDYRDEGEFFGLISLLSGESSPFTILAEEDTLCYLVKKEVFKRLLDEHPSMLLYFTTGPSKGFKQLCLETGPPGPSGQPESSPGEEILFTGRVRDLMSSNVLTCPPEETVVGIARRMTGMGVGSAVVVDEAGVPVGIVTDGDFRIKVVASGKLSNLPVIDVMSRPLLSIPSEAFCFEAILSMMTNRIKHLPVMDGLELKGIISEHDLMVSQGHNPMAVIKGIRQAADIEQVVLIRRRIDQALNVILERGGMARDICELITTFNDHLTQKIISLSEEAMVLEGKGRPPVPYSWIALGSEGRREQTLRTDQDNAILFADASPEKEEEARNYFLALAEKVVSGLERCGFPRCKGEIMASNPRWCQPEHVWKGYFRHWILDFDYPREEVLQTFVFFDFRPIYGAPELMNGFWESVSDFLTGRESFLKDMAETAVLHETPLGFFKRLVVEKSGEHRNQLNLKLNGLTPLVDAVRTLALDQRIFETNTLDRISALIEKEILTLAEAEDLRDAFNVIMLVRVRHHVSLIQQGSLPDNYIDPEALSIIQRAMLKEAFKSIDKLRRMLELRYRLRPL